jgi:hypothetical protein
MSTVVLTVSLLLLLILSVTSWTTISSSRRNIASSQHNHCLYFLTTSQLATASSTSIYAGFGNTNEKKKKQKKDSGTSGSSSSSSSNNNNVVKLKPKQQWDRYMNDLKKMTGIIVGVRVMITTDDDSTSTNAKIAWIPVGRIKSIDDKYTDFAIARQRALIADVSIYNCKLSNQERYNVCQFILVLKGMGKSIFFR